MSAYAASGHMVLGFPGSAVSFSTYSSGDGRFVTIGAEPAALAGVLLGSNFNHRHSAFTIDPLSLAWQRFAGTALGAALGALVAMFFPGTNWVVYGCAIFLCGIFCGLLQLESAYRFAAIALSIVLPIAHAAPPRQIAVHRFVEVSLAIAVALIVTIVWKCPVRKGPETRLTCLK